jgi:uroporphyrinogen decarboxylase
MRRRSRHNNAEGWQSLRSDGTPGIDPRADMTSRERLLECLAGELPDCVPVAPDFSNMIPARRTGRPFWDLYLYNDPPIWEAYIDCARHFDIDSVMDGYFPFAWPSDPPDQRPSERFIVFRSDQRIVVQRSYLEGGSRVWEEHVTVYYRADPPTQGVRPARIGLPPVPASPEPLTGVRPVDRGPSGLRRVKRLMGDQGLVGVGIIGSLVVHNEEEILLLHDDPGRFERLIEERDRIVERRFADLMAMDAADRPDFLCVGGSGTLVFQSPATFRHYALPAVKKAIDLAAAAGIPTHVHSCGPERELVRIFAEETSLTVIDPLEPPPMGDCDLAELRRLHGDKIVLKGNLHTTDVMLRGSAADVAAASREAIDAAAGGGRFILSTGDQCGRDTPDDNLHAMVETARTYGRYGRAGA